MILRQIGSIYLILGTCIAAGLLAAPIATAGNTYMFTLIMLFSAWLLMSIGAWLLFAYMVMVRTQILYLNDLLQAKKGRLLSQTHFSQTSP